MQAMHQLVRQHLAPEEEEDGSEDDQRDPILRQYERQREEVNLLKMELKALANSIQETKREIAQLRSGEEDSDRLNAVTSELDAVVGATERATDGILDAAEKIDTIAHTLKANSADAYSSHLAEEVTEHVMTIFEHSNFQDITGQRITKVVNTLKFVEERVDKMIEIWGREAFQDMLDEDEPSVDEDNRLLNGPQQAGAGISQDEIDKLFD
jgi:chemotaxis protein CheZ